VSEAATGTWPRRRSPVLDWLMLETYGEPYFDNIFAELCRRLCDRGLPLDRATLHLRTLHPQFMGATVYWQPDWGEARFARFGHTLLEDARYLRSPLKPLFEGEVEGIRQRLDVPRPEGAPWFGIYDELEAAGFIDYVALPMTFVSGTRHASTWATQRPGGFDTEHLSTIDDLLPVLAMVVEIRLNRRIARNLLEAYVGPRAGERILAGEIRRGSGETVSAAVWMCDLRGFTRLSGRMPHQAVIDCLNRYFDVMAAAVTDHGGEILKFIGDAMLAIFPLEDADACSRAFEAALAAKAGMEALELEHCLGADEAIGFSIVLHAGDVVWGNVGAAARLDFTVIGPAVNVASRLEELAKRMDEPIIVTREFAGGCRGAADRLESLGRFALRDVADEVELLRPRPRP